MATTHKLATPFMVIATQNPIEHEGTYPLPESQLDRFLMKISVGYPGRGGRTRHPRSSRQRCPLSEIEPVVTAARITRQMTAARAISHGPLLRGYIVDIAEATRRHPALTLGMSTRRVLALQRVARVQAASVMRTYVTPDDVKLLARPVLAHRLLVAPKRKCRASPAPRCSIRSSKPCLFPPGSADPMRRLRCLRAHPPGMGRRVRQRVRDRCRSRCWGARTSVLGVIGLGFVIARAARLVAAGGFEVTRQSCPRGCTQAPRAGSLVGQQHRNAAIAGHARGSDPVSGTRGRQPLVAPLQPNVPARASYRLPTERRGVVDVGPLTPAHRSIRPSDAAISAAGSTNLTVYPPVHRLPALPPPVAPIRTPGSNTDAHSSAAAPTSTRCASIVVGDELRRVHWPSTARHDELMVRQDELPWQGRLTVVVDNTEGRLPEDGLDLATCIAASVVSAAHQKATSCVSSPPTAPTRLPGGQRAGRIAARDARRGQPRPRPHCAPPSIRGSRRCTHGGVVTISAELDDHRPGRSATTRAAFRQRVHARRRPKRVRRDRTRSGGRRVASLRPRHTQRAVPRRVDTRHGDVLPRGVRVITATIASTPDTGQGPPRVAKARPAGEAKRPSPSAFAELALVACSLALVFGFSRIFEDRSFFWRVATFSTVAHLLAITSVASAAASSSRRWRRSSVSCSPSASCCIARRPPRLFPHGPRATRCGSTSTGAWKLFTDTRTPVPVHPGFVLAACVAMWIVAFLADWAAFRLWSPFEALAPARWCSCSVRSRPRRTIGCRRHSCTPEPRCSSCSCIAPPRSTSLRIGSPPNRRDGREAMVRIGAAVALGAILFGVFVGPVLPGSDSEGAIAWRRFGKSDKQDDSRVTVSPLVTIRSRIVNQANVEAFQVDADQPDYWRLTALDLFDGANWTSSGEYQTAKGQLPSSLPTTVTTQTVTQTLHDLCARTSRGYPPRTNRSASPPMAAPKRSTNPSRARSPSATRSAAREGATYTVESPRARARHRPVECRDRCGRSCADTRSVLPVAPAGLTSFVRTSSHASRTSVQRHRSEHALALQNFFRSDAFSYSLNVSLDQSVDSIDRFLRARVGYCEQYASAYAAMARYLGSARPRGRGLHARRTRTTTGVWVVRGEHAHAWPEVYLAGCGLGSLRADARPRRPRRPGVHRRAVPTDRSRRSQHGHDRATDHERRARAPAPRRPTDPQDLADAAPIRARSSREPRVVAVSCRLTPPWYATPSRSAHRPAHRRGGSRCGAVPRRQTTPPHATPALTSRHTASATSPSAWEDAAPHAGPPPAPLSSADTPLEAAERVARGSVPEGARDPLADVGASSPPPPATARPNRRRTLLPAAKPRRRVPWTTACGPT